MSILVMHNFLTAENTVLNLNVALLAFMIIISLLLIVILSLLLRCTLKRFRKKPTSHRSRDTAGPEVREGGRAGSPHLNIMRTQLDLDMPYASLSSVAPPSYEDTLLADQIVQQDLAPEYTSLEGDSAAEAEEESNSSADNLALLPAAEGSTDSNTNSRPTTSVVPEP